MANREKQQSAQKQPDPKKAYEGLKAPSIELPKGGGAIKSIGEKFSVNAANGTSSFNFPLPFSTPGGLVPDLTIAYNSGTGNGIFGIGWALTLPTIRRKTEQELPRYQDSIDSDTYIFSQAEDLVPVLTNTSGKWKKLEKDSPDHLYIIRFYRPRIEGLFARIERWTSKKNGRIHWRVITKDNSTTIFGSSNSAAIADPKDPLRIFEWLPELVFNDKGHCVVYEYKTEDAKNINASLLHERNRVNGYSPFTNTYLKRIRHGNTEMYKQAGDSLPAHFLFEVVFDYGDHSTALPPYTETGNWPYRPDAFSDYQAGFEIRTCRRCEHVFFYHHIKELPGASAIVRSIEFSYSDNGIDGFTFLTGITETGYIKKVDGTYTQKSAPPFSFGYQQHEWNDTIHTLSRQDLLHSPSGIDESKYQWVDLYSEGLSGILTEQGNGLFYKSNLGNGNFTEAKQILSRPSFSGWGEDLQIQELDSNGVKQLVQLAKEPKGFFEYTADDKWQNFFVFEQVPNIDFKNPNLKQLDLDGDGLADILISEDDVFTWYPSSGKKGYQKALRFSKPQDEETGPAIVFADETQSIFLADMNGDGLTDIVRVRNGEVCYWPNLGLGRFAAKVNMSHAPLMDTAGQFNPAQVLLADIDGSGTPDLIYLDKSGCRIWINRQGNSFATEAKTISPFPAVNNHTKVSMLDLLGKGLGCIVWNSTLPGSADAPVKYIDLMAGKKPHLLNCYKNNMGKEVYLEYLPSTHYYLEDKKAGNAWITKLPFPVQCVSKVIVYDRIRQTRFASEYSYHHGYYDAFEREFRGFGRVDQLDAESITSFNRNSGGMTNNIEQKDLHQLPVLIKSWYHTGAFFNRHNILNHFSKEYYNNNAFAEYQMPEPHLDALPGAEDYREAMRTCKGMLLRKEVYVAGNTAADPILYVAEQHTAKIKLLQGKAINKHGVFSLHETEAITYHYEQDPRDPRIVHLFNIEVNEFGEPVRTALVAYGRMTTDSELTTEEQEAQKKTHITCNWKNYTNAIINLDTEYRSPLLWQERSYEITGIVPSVLPYFSFTEMDDAADPATGGNIAYHEKPSVGLQRRIIEWERVKFRDNDGNTVLKYGELQSKGLLHEKYKAAFTDALLDEIFEKKTTASLLSPVLTSKKAEGGGYIKEDDYYWIPSGVQNYLVNAFYLSTEYTNPFGKKTILEYDPYYLFISKVTDPVANTISVKQYNYRVMQPLQIEDANQNTIAVRFDELGIVVSSFAIGKGSDKGDVFDASTVEISGKDQPGVVYSYDLFEWYKQSTTAGFDPNKYYEPRPNFVYAKIWEVHYNAMPARSTQYQQVYTYFDGFGKQLLTKTQAEPGLARRIKNDGTVEIINTSPNNRWIGDGRVILNNKGNPVKKYEPYFSVDAGFDDEKEMVELGVSQVLHYDPLDREIKKENPDGSFINISFSAWKQVHHDENDNIGLSEWNKKRMEYLKTLPENNAQQIARKKYRIRQQSIANDNTSEHAATPSVHYLDALGKTFLMVADNRTEKLKTGIVYDIEGNERSVIDAMEREVMRYEYDMCGNKVLQKSMDAGKRWNINNVAGQPVLAWDSRGNSFEFAYDEMQRLVKTTVTKAGTSRICERLEYGENVADSQRKNLRGKLYRRYDQAGIITHSNYDFKNNILAISRKFCQEYTKEINWVDPGIVSLETEEFVNSMQYDALNRPVSIITPHTTAIPASEVLPVYNENGLLKQLNVKLRNPAAVTPFVTGISYNAKRQREAIQYKNGTATSYGYDPFTYRLESITTTRSGRTASLQDIIYIYDPAGNITAIRDDAQDEINYGGELIKPENQFLYDALYRLSSVTGRKHIGQNVIDHKGSAGNFRNHPFMSNAGTPGPDDANAFCNYTEAYIYDKAGNMQSQTHRAAKFPWTRSFKYGLVKGDNKNNQLREVTAGSDTFSYDYDEHGNMKNMEHLQQLGWNFTDQLAHTKLTGGRDAWYVYDAAGERVRKVLHDSTGKKQQERFYLGGFEVYREYTATGVVNTERESLHIMDDKRRIALVEIQTIDKSMPVVAPVFLQRYQYDNHLGSASLELDESAAIISYEEYYPFGATSYQAGKGTKEVPLKRYRYIGKERDEESGLNYHSARYYAPWLCRWISADPIGIKDGLNVYSYVSNKCISFYDPSGLAKEDPPEKIRERKIDKVLPALRMQRKLQTVFTVVTLASAKANAAGEFKLGGEQSHKSGPQKNKTETAERVHNIRQNGAPPPPPDPTKPYPVKVNASLPVEEMWLNVPAAKNTGGGSGSGSGSGGDTALKISPVTDSSSVPGSSVSSLAPKNSQPLHPTGSTSAKITASSVPNVSTSTPGFKNSPVPSLTPRPQGMGGAAVALTSYDLVGKGLALQAERDQNPNKRIVTQAETKKEVKKIWGSTALTVVGLILAIEVPIVALAVGFLFMAGHK